MSAASLPRDVPSPGGPRARRLLVIAALVLVFALVVAFELPLCPTATFLGVPCPGCGLTRASLALLRADFAAALAWHPLSPLMTPLLALLVGRAALAYVGFVPPSRPDDARRARWTTRVGLVLLALLLGVWAARFFGAFGGPVPVSSPVRDLVERQLGR